MADTTGTSIHRRLRKPAAAAVLALTAVAIPVATAAPAAADELHCVDYLRREHVLIGPKVVDACNKGASDSFVVQQVCFPLLVNAGLSAPKADRACYFAREY
ncbi:hypothetical protein [Pseudonocardia sp. MH-G8]|uniref:hypothetical protein n=1 Tax=Pseudonocardia sp. MH-G8 TaxID=1854588 RepID=UPI000B9FF47E|nr:hypothetical protein [Pseudonocardia sp. MH-G8]OZM77801.1 hypothetical protein CFP66_34110 [Pseudonocardia sp. MH-G8]